MIKAELAIFTLKISTTTTTS